VLAQKCARAASKRNVIGHLTRTTEKMSDY